MAQIDTETQPSLTLHFAVEHSDILVPHLRVETSIDGYNWQQLQPQPAIECHSTGHLSSQPLVPFPETFLTSEKAQSAIHAASSGQVTRSKGWFSGKLASAASLRSRLNKCAVVVPSNAGVGRRRKGWRFVRLVVVSDELELVDEQGLGVGWGVYEMWIT